MNNIKIGFLENQKSRAGIKGRVEIRIRFQQGLLRKMVEEENQNTKKRFYLIFIGFSDV